MTVVNSNRYPSAVEKSALSSQSYGGLYIDNFTRPQSRPVLEINDYISPDRGGRKAVEVFHDDLNSNYSSISRQSKESAFDRS
jgi:hypothetical protein